MDHLNLRAAERSDSSRIAALGIQVWLHAYATEGVSRPIARYVLNEFTEARVDRLIKDSSRKIIVAEIGDNLVGYVALRFESPLGELGNEIESLYVQEHFASRGVGRALLREARHEADRTSGTCCVWLTVNAKNLHAIRFYRRSGFSEGGETYFELEGTKHRNLVMLTTTG